MQTLSSTISPSDDKPVPHMIPMVGLWAVWLRIALQISSTESYSWLNSNLQTEKQSTERRLVNAFLYTKSI